MLLVALLLVAALLACLRFVSNDVRSFARFKAAGDTVARQRTFLRWTRRAAVTFLGMPLVGLALLGRLDALVAFPPEFAPAMAAVPAMPALSPGFAAGVLAAVAVGGIVGGLLAARRRPGRSRRLDIDAMVPRNRAEALRVALLGANAAVCEELFFRLYLPLLLVLLGTAPWLGFALSTLLFGAMHRYQGWAGVALTTLLGALFGFAALASGGLAVPILLHLLVNLNGLILRPAVEMLARRRAD